MVPGLTPAHSADEALHDSIWAISNRISHVLLTSICETELISRYVAIWRNPVQSPTQKS